MNLLPLIDVLVMLIFFAFVTMQFKSATTLNISLPKIETAGKNEFKGNITIAIDEHGVISFNGKIATKQQLVYLLQRVSAVTRDLPVLIRADKKTQFDNVTCVMDACRKNGLNKLHLDSSK